MHDKNGNLLDIGDTVSVQCIVKTLYTGKEYCNITLETVEPMYPGNNRSSFTLNTKQVEKVTLIEEKEYAEHNEVEG